MSAWLHTNHWDDFKIPVLSVSVDLGCNPRVCICQSSSKSSWPWAKRGSPGCPLCATEKITLFLGLRGLICMHMNSRVGHSLSVWLWPSNLTRQCFSFFNNKCFARIKWVKFMWNAETCNWDIKLFYSFLKLIIHLFFSHHLFRIYKVSSIVFSHLGMCK